MAINPLQQPINYSVDVQSPFEAAIGGIKLGTGLEELNVARQNRAMELQQQQAAQAQQAQFQSGLNSFFAKPAAERTFDELQLLLIGANKQQFDALKLVGEQMGAEKLGSAKKFTSQVLLAFEANPETAKTLLRERIEAEPDPGQKRAFQVISSIADQDPSRASRLVESLGAGTFGPEWYKGIEDYRKARREAEMQPTALKKAQADADKAVADAQAAQATAANAAEKATADAAKASADAQKSEAEARVAEATTGTKIIKAKSEADEAAVKARFAEQLAQGNVNLNAAQIRNINSEIGNRAAKLNLDRQTMQATVAEKLSNIQKNIGDVPADTRKLVNESAVAAAAAKQSAGQYNDVARRLDAEGGGYGVFTSARDYLDKAFGTQSSLTELRQEYTRIRNSAAIKSLPPGVATDKDIELALKGIPPENANASTMASFLRGMGKMQDIEASVANAKTDWLASNNGTLTRAKNTFIAGDYAAKPGETFADFTQRIVGDVSQKYRSPGQTAETRRQQAIGQIPTNSAPAAAPAANSANIMSQADAILRGGR
jgi:hypothetical protein